MKAPDPTKTSLRKKADYAKTGRCKNLIAVLEAPRNIENIGTVIRNINVLGLKNYTLLTDLMYCQTTGKQCVIKRNY